MQSPAWIEPGTLSVCLYCSSLLLRGQAGTRVLSRHLRRGGEAVTGVALDEFSDFLCDHPDAMLTVLLCSLAGPRCRLVARAPALLRTTRSLKSLTRATRTLTRSGRDKLLHLLRGVDPSPAGIALQQAQAKPDEPGAVRGRTLSAHRLRVPVLLQCEGGRSSASLHLLRQLAAAGLRGWEEEARPNQKASAADGSSCPLHDGARDHPIP
jgi:hypothetical protein